MSDEASTDLVAGFQHVVDDMPPGARVELIVVERHKQRLRSLDLKPAASYPVASSVADQRGRAALAVPAELPRSYDGVTLAFSYELEVSAGASGSTSWPVEVTGGPLPTTLPPRSSPPLKYSKLVAPAGVRHARKERIEVGLFALGAAAALLLFGRLAVDLSDTTNLALLLGGACVFGALGVGSLSVLWSRGRHLDGVEISQTPSVVAPGEVLTVGLSKVPGLPAELRLFCTEFVDASYKGSSGRVNTARFEVIHEDVQPFEGDPVRFVIPEDAVLPFAGRGIGVHWLIAVQLRSRKAGSGAELVNVVSSAAGTTLKAGGLRADGG